jgi:p-aminobenzoyl-glutamate transporter AbgT
MSDAGISFIVLSEVVLLFFVAWYLLGIPMGPGSPAML